MISLELSIFLRIAFLKNNFGRLLLKQMKRKKTHHFFLHGITRVNEVIFSFGLGLFKNLLL